MHEGDDMISMSTSPSTSSSSDSNSNSNSNSTSRSHSQTISKAIETVKDFYSAHPEIKASHGWNHIQAVYNHTIQALSCLKYDSDCDDNDNNNNDNDDGGLKCGRISSKVSMEIQLAALLHDVDDKKYFPKQEHNGNVDMNGCGEHTKYLYLYPNAIQILATEGIDILPQTTHLEHEQPPSTCTRTGTFSSKQHDEEKTKSSSSSFEQILQMISWVSCSENGNSIPPALQTVTSSKHNNIQTQGKGKNHCKLHVQLPVPVLPYHLLIPRWADRLEAVGARGVVRCYLYTLENGGLLSTTHSPRPQSEQELWDKYVNMDVDVDVDVHGIYRKNKLQEYMDRGGISTDMISHYYDKLLHIARPPKDIVRNSYLENKAAESSKELVEVCLRFGRTGKVDEDYIKSLMV